MKHIFTYLTALLLAPLAALHAGEPSLMKPDEHKYLMVDSRIVCNVQNAKLVLGSPVKATENPLFQADKPWENALNNLYPNVLWDEHERVFKLWYKCVLADTNVIAKMDSPSTVHDVGWYLLYATSQDGVRWTKPALGLFKHEGSDANNIVARDCPNVGVFKDLHEAEAGRRYKMVFDVGLGKPRVRFSPDGIHWEPAIEALGFGAKNGDTHNNAVWDGESGKYFWFTKLWLGERTMARFESDDFIHWKNNGMVLRSTTNEARNSQTYCMTPFRYGRHWLAYVMIYHPGKGRSVDCELAWSPDALRWERVKPGTPFIPRGAKGTYDSECIYAMAGPPIVQDGQLLIYYGGDDFPHTGWKRSCLPCLARLPVDRFAGYTAVEKERPATLLTAQLIATEKPICISADAAGGSIRITAIDDTTGVIDETEPVTGNVTDFAVKWKNQGLSKHIRRRIQLRIEMNNATLWSIAGIELAEQTPRPPINPLNDPDRKNSR
jgi:hypothetical protein